MKCFKVKKSQSETKYTWCFGETIYCKRNSYTLLQLKHEFIEAWDTYIETGTLKSMLAHQLIQFIGNLILFYEYLLTSM